MMGQVMGEGQAGTTGVEFNADLQILCRVALQNFQHTVLQKESNGW